MSAALYRSLLDTDATLARHGFPKLSDWWREQFAAFYLHRTASDEIARVGRGGAKSTAGVRFGVNQTLFGDWKIPPGERHVFAIVSENVSEAQQRLRLIEAYLRALGVGFDRAGDAIDLHSMPRGFRVLACRVGAVSGFRSYGFAADEVAKWKTESGSNPANEVIASLRAMTVTHAGEGVKNMIVSSPVGCSGLHYELVERGTNDRQVVAIAPSWVANPGAITQEETKRLEPDHRIWLREYAAIPQAGALGAFDAEATERAFRPLASGATLCRPSLVLDPSSGKKDAWAWGFVRWTWEGDRSVLQVVETKSKRGRFFLQLSAEKVVAEVAADAKARDVGIAHSDQREAYALGSLFRAEGLGFCEHAWTNEAKVDAVARLRRLFAEDRIVLPVGADDLRRELLAFEERVTPNGAFTFGARGSGHDDTVALLLTAMMVDAAGELTRWREGDAPRAHSGPVMDAWEYRDRTGTWGDYTGADEESGVQIDEHGRRWNVLWTEGPAPAARGGKWGSGRGY